MLKPYGSTFLMFSDYMRPAVRLSALIAAAGRCGSGRTTRSASARTARPTSRSSTDGAARDPEPLGPPAGRRERDRRGAGGSRWSARAGPVALALIAPEAAGARAARVSRRRPRGRSAARTSLWQRDESTAPDAIVLATGSEVSLALEAARSLEANARVVSMPCWELFDEQDAGVPRRGAAAVGPCRASRSRRGSPSAGSGGSARTGCGSASTASAPRRRGRGCYEELGLTAEAVADAVRRLV